MPNEDRKTLNELQATLARIANGQKVFFNLAKFRQWGLITETNTWGTDSSGNKVGTKYGLTEKAEQFLSIVV